MNEQKEISSSSIGILLLLALIWGSSFILIKKSLEGFDPFEVAALRISISSLAFLPILILEWENIPWNKSFLFLLVGLTGSGIPAFMFPLGQTEISSSIAGILNSTTPIFTFLVGILLFNSRFAFLKFAGILLGLIGTSLLILYGAQDDIGGKPLYAIFMLIGTFCYGTNINVVKTFFQNIKPTLLSAVSFAMIGPPAIIYLARKGTVSQIITNQIDFSSTGAVILLAIFGTVISTVLFFKLVQKTNAVFASSVSYLIPIVATVFGFMDGESIGIYHFLGMAMILLGVYLIKKGKTVS